MNLIKTILNQIFLIISSLKWALDFLIFHSFFQSSALGDVQLYHTNHDIVGECAVCLSEIEEAEEVRELKCSHIFHMACFERWAAYGRRTCPLCRNPQLDNDERMIYQQVLVFNFCEIRAGNNETWWLR